MSVSEAGGFPGSNSAEAWIWWQRRRLRYNLALGGAGWIAYGLNAALFHAFGRPIWHDWPGALSMTLFLGVAFLLLIGVANVCYLLGPALESSLRPGDIAGFRRTAFAMGFWGSLAVPFALPGANLAILIGNAS